MNNPLVRLCLALWAPPTRLWVWATGRSCFVAARALLAVSLGIMLAGFAAGTVVDGVHPALATIVGVGYTLLTPGRWRQIVVMEKVDEQLRRQTSPPDGLVFYSQSIPHGTVADAVIVLAYALLVTLHLTAGTLPVAEVGTLAWWSVFFVSGQPHAGGGGKSLPARVWDRARTIRLPRLLPAPTPIPA